MTMFCSVGINVLTLFITTQAHILWIVESPGKVVCDVNNDTIQKMMGGEKTKL
jgi:hypothetical protein